MANSSVRTLALWSCMMVSSVIAQAEDLPALQVSAEGINAQGVIEPKYAFCTMVEKGHSKPSENVNIGVRWTAGPEGTQSYALVMVDEDVPVDFSNANKENVTLPASQPRRPFYHWVLTNIPANVTAIPAGAESNSTQPKTPGKTSYGVAAINDYSSGDVVHGGYDGPCPPWNDERLHHYYIRVYALDVPTIQGVEKMEGSEAMKAIEPHIIASGQLVGTYTTNPAVLGTK